MRAAEGGGSSTLHARGGGGAQQGEAQHARGAGRTLTSPSRRVSPTSSPPSTSPHPPPRTMCSIFCSSAPRIPSLGFDVATRLRLFSPFPPRGWGPGDREKGRDARLRPSNLRPRASNLGPPGRFLLDVFLVKFDHTTGPPVHHTVGDALVFEIGGGREAVQVLCRWVIVAGRRARGASRTLRGGRERERGGRRL